MAQTHPHRTQGRNCQPQSLTSPRTFAGSNYPAAISITQIRRRENPFGSLSKDAPEQAPGHFKPTTTLHVRHAFDDWPKPASALLRPRTSNLLGYLCLLTCLV